MCGCSEFCWLISWTRMLLKWSHLTVQRTLLFSYTTELYLPIFYLQFSRLCSLVRSVYSLQFVGDYEWNNTKQDTHQRQTHTPAGGTELGKKLIAVYYKSPLGRIPDCMNKPFQHSAGAYLLPYSKGEWNPCLLQSLPKALISFLSQEGNAPLFARDH